MKIKTSFITQAIPAEKPIVHFLITGRSRFDTMLSLQQQFQGRFTSLLSNVNQNKRKIHLRKH